VSGGNVEKRTIPWRAEKNPREEKLREGTGPA